MKKNFLKIIRIDFVRFCIVGGVGFIINLIVLSVFHGLFHLSIFASQFFGAEIALFSNFLLHNSWTYRHKNVRNRKKRNLLLQFHATTWPAILGSTLMVGFLVSIFHTGSIEALVISSFTALLWNFTWSKFVIWRDVTDKEVVENA